MPISIYFPKPSDKEVWLENYGGDSSQELSALVDGCFIFQENVLGYSFRDEKNHVLVVKKKFERKPYFVLLKILRFQNLFWI
jgi:hypothetical protein